MGDSRRQSITWAGFRQEMRPVFEALRSPAGGHMLLEQNMFVERMLPRAHLRQSGFKAVIENDTARIFGAHLLGEHAEEVINLFDLAIRTGLRSSDLGHMVHR